MAFPETTIEPEFYPNWPKFGKQFSKQLNEIRSDTNTLHPIVRAHGLDPSYVTVSNAAVQAIEVGETDFHNKYRVYWDDDEETFRIQANIGTSGTPSWADRLTIDQAGGLFGDFYVARSFVTTTNTTDSIYNEPYLKFNRGDFYLAPDSSGNPIVNLAGTAPMGQVLLQLNTLQEIAVNTAAQLSSGYTVIRNTRGWTTSSTTGVTIPSGVNQVRVQAQLQWEEVTATASWRSIQIWKNGAALDPPVEEKIFRPAPSGAPALNAIQGVTSYPIYVAAGDTINLAANQTNNVEVDVVALGATWLYVEEVR